MGDKLEKDDKASSNTLIKSCTITVFGLISPVIPYTIKVTTGEGEDNGTNSNVWVKIYGPQKKHTGRLFLELAQKDQFAPGSVEIFSLEAAELEEIKKIEVRDFQVAKKFERVPSEGVSFVKIRRERTLY